MALEKKEDCECLIQIKNNHAKMWLRCEPCKKKDEETKRFFKEIAENNSSNHTKGEK